MIDELKKKAIFLIAISTILRCIIASCLELGNDEVYYRMYAQYLQWNYFDHPPMVAWLIRITTFNLFADNSLFVRIGAIISAAVTSYLLYLCGKKLNNSYTGYLAVVIYTATLYGSIIAGTFILPDSPQTVYWVGGLYLLLCIVRTNSIDKSAKKNMLLFGIVVGIAMLCKIHSIFLWVGFLGYVCCYNRKWIMQPTLYIAGFITLLLFYPVIQWNINNHFVTYLFHGKRVAIGSSGLEFSSFFTFLAGQIFYYNPIIVFYILMATIAGLRNKISISSYQKKLLFFCSFPLLVICTVAALFNTILPHWTAPSFVTLVLLTAAYFAQKKPGNIITKMIFPKPLQYAIGLLIGIIIGGIILVNFYPGTTGKKEILFLGEGDFTLDMYGWKSIKEPIKKIIQKDILTGEMKSDASIVCNKWFPAAHIDKYIAMPLHKNFMAIGDTNDIHQYAWINNNRKKLKTGDDAYCIVPSNNYEDVRILYKKYFKTILPPIIIEQKRNGIICRYFYVWRLKSYLN